MASAQNVPRNKYETEMMGEHQPLPKISNKNILGVCLWVQSRFIGSVLHWLAAQTQTGAHYHQIII